jgi:glycerol kinase
MQIQADLLTVPLERPKLLEATALGAVALAGLGAKVWSSFDDVRSGWQRDREFTPTGDPHRYDALRRAWTEAIERA